METDQVIIGTLLSGAACTEILWYTRILENNTRRWFFSETSSIAPGFLFPTVSLCFKMCRSELSMFECRRPTY